MIKDLCIEIIETCTNNCMFCSSNSDCKKSRIIKFEDFKRVIDYFMSNGGIEELSLSGGEPFLHPELFKMVSYAKSLGIKTVIFTSGVVKRRPLNKDEIDALELELNKRLEEIEKIEPDNDYLKSCIVNSYTRQTTLPKVTSIFKGDLLKLKSMGLDKIVFDYQAYEYDTDHYLMGRGENSRIALLKSLLTASQSGLEVDVHFIPMKPNYREIGDILEMLEIAEVKNISILNFLPQGRGKTNQQELQLSDREKEEFFEILDKHKKYFSGNVRIGIPLQGENTHKCNAGLEKLDIRFDGTVLPCPAFKEITLEECRKYNIDLPNIYTNLEDVKIPGRGTRVKPLCQEIYNERAKRE